MEKYSAYRDPGTGIQPFLPPVPPQGSNVLAQLLLPINVVVGCIRTVLVLCLALVYLLVVQLLLTLLTPIPLIYDPLSHFITALLARLTLLVAGLFWIPVEIVTRKRGRNDVRNQKWSPKAGDVIISNWVSWIEILWVAFRFNPVFVLPVTSTVNFVSSREQGTSTPPRRRFGTGSADIPELNAAKNVNERAEILGFRRISLLRAVCLCGLPPPYGFANGSGSAEPLEEIRKRSGRPVVVFPECTTSNGRGLLRFANIFKGVDLPVTNYSVFIMCVRIDPPTAFLPTLSLTIPSFANPLRHIFLLCSTLWPHSVSIRLLAMSDSPSSPLFLVSEVISERTEDLLAEASASLIATIGRMKRTGMGWEAKARFLHYYQAKQK